MENRAGKTTTGKHDTGKALAMLDIFASVGAGMFDLSITDLDRNPVEGQQRPGRSLEDMRRMIGGVLQDAEIRRHNVIIRPRSTTALLVQLDDFSEEKAAQIEPYAFMTLRTSPGNYQVWLALSDGPKESEKEAAKQLRTRVRRGARSDKSATGATRIAGSLNFKAEYAPDFPVVAICRQDAGRFVTVYQLENAGLIAPLEQPQPPASVPPQTFPRPVANRKWPDYQQALRGAPMNRDSSGPDRSLADFMWSKWAVQRGWSVEETAAKLMEVSEKAQEQARRKDEGYASVTAWNASQAVERDRMKHPSVKSTAYPR